MRTTKYTQKEITTMKKNNKIATAVKLGVAIVNSDENRLWTFVKLGNMLLNDEVKQVELIKRVKVKTGKTLDKGDLSKAVRINKACLVGATRDSVNAFQRKLEAGKFPSLNAAYHAALDFTPAQTQTKKKKRVKKTQVVVTTRKAESLAKRFVPANKRDAFVRALGLTA